MATLLNRRELLMKSTHLVILCVLLVLQGISQSYAAQMMSAKATAQMDTMVMDQAMPCHGQAEETQPKAMDDCCDQDCQCHFVSSAMSQHSFHWQAFKTPHPDHGYQPALLVTSLSNLYRPPISA